MKKYILHILLLICCLSNAKAQNITHTLQFKVFGSYSADFGQGFAKEDLNLSVLNYGVNNWLWNLIPSYELGYKNKWFFKLQHTGMGSMENGIYYVDYIGESGTIPIQYREQMHYLTLYASYNLFPSQWEAHRLKLGIGPGFYIGVSKVIDRRDKKEIVETSRPYGAAFGLQLSYQWLFRENLYIGAETNYIQSIAKKHMFSIDYNVGLGITFGIIF